MQLVRIGPDEPRAEVGSHRRAHHRIIGWGPNRFITVHSGKLRPGEAWREWDSELRAWRMFVE